MRTAAARPDGIVPAGAQTQVAKSVNPLIRPRRCGLRWQPSTNWRSASTASWQPSGRPTIRWTCSATTRGVYLEGFGVVFTSELSLIVSPTINPFHQTITDKEKAQTHQRKIDRLPLLKKGHARNDEDGRHDADPDPGKPADRVRRAAGLPAWEDTTGLPGLIDHAGRPQIGAGGQYHGRAQ